MITSLHRGRRSPGARAPEGAAAGHRRATCRTSSPARRERPRGARARCRASGAQVLLLDIRMPGMDGLELARQWRRCEMPPAVVFVTAHDKHAVEAFELNALDYLLKPVRAARLAAALKKAAARGAPRREQLARAAGGAARVPVGGGAQPHRAGAGARHPVPARRAEVRHRAHARARAPDRGIAGRAREASSAARAPTRSCASIATASSRAARSAASSAPAAARRRRTGRWCSTALPERLPVSRRQWPTVRELVADKSKMK